LTNTQRQKSFKKEELREFNGDENRPVYVAFKGEVYDLSSSRLWINGKHQGHHSAGNDLTKSILSAPHSEEVLRKFPVVGALSKEEASQSKLVQWIQKLHLHPISVHFGIAYSIAFPLLAILYVLTGEVSFETASCYMLLLGSLSAPVAGLSGYFSWKVTYGGRKNSIFARKEFFAVILLVVIFICLFWRTFNPNLLTTRTSLSYIYLLLAASLAPIVTILGYLGGEIVYP
jgi:predicted heme/steroid binding protein/uncharacterized membrane protein